MPQHWRHVWKRMDCLRSMFRASNYGLVIQEKKKLKMRRVHLPMKWGQHYINEDIKIFLYLVITERSYLSKKQTILVKNLFVIVKMNALLKPQVKDELNIDF